MLTYFRRVNRDEKFLRVIEPKVSKDLQNLIEFSYEKISVKGHHFNETLHTILCAMSEEDCRDLESVRNVLTQSISADVYYNALIGWFADGEHTEDYINNAMEEYQGDSNIFELLRYSQKNFIDDMINTVIDYFLETQGSV